MEVGIKTSRRRREPVRPRRFEGAAEEVETHVQQMKTYLNAMSEESEHRKICFAVSFLKGNAQIWYRSLLLKQNFDGQAFLTLNEYCEALKKTFLSEFHRRRFRDRLADWKQERTVKEAVLKFREIRRLLPDVTEDEYMDRFTRGLQPHIALEVLRADPQTVEDALRIAVRAEQIINQYHNTCGEEKSKKSSRGRTCSKEDASTRENSGHRTEEKNRVCYHCLKVGHISRNCPAKKTASS